MERGNGHAKHEPERRDSRKELIAAARMQFDALRAVGILTPGPARSIVHLLESDEGTLSKHGRVFRDNGFRQRFLPRCSRLMEPVQNRRLRRKGGA